MSKMITIPYELGAICKTHSQPPIDSPARVQQYARTVTPDMTIAELIEWADDFGLESCIGIEITIERRRS